MGVKELRGFLHELNESGKVVIPPPDKVKFMVISRDPTDEYCYLYQYLKGLKKTQRLDYFLAGIPNGLISKFVHLLEDKEEKRAELTKKLWGIFLEKCYWTHLYKYPSPNKNKDKRKKATNILHDEIDTIGDSLKLIIALGSDVANALLEKDKKMEWYLENEKRKWHSYCSKKVCVLPHPSGQNNSIWKGTDKKSEQAKRYRKMHKSIEELIPDHLVPELKKL